MIMKSDGMAWSLLLLTAGILLLAYAMALMVPAP